MFSVLEPQERENGRRENSITDFVDEASQGYWHSVVHLNRLISSRVR